MDNFLELLTQFEVDRGIGREVLLGALEDALRLAYRKNYDNEDALVRIDPHTGAMSIFIRKYVTEHPYGNEEISLSEAREINPIYNIGDAVEIPVEVASFGRIAASAARQVVMQRIREAERGNIWNEYADKQHKLLTGIVRRIEKRNVLIDIGKVEAVLAPSEQSPADTYTPGTHIKVYIAEVARTNKGPQINISRTHPGLVRCLFELEVPEIKDKVVEIKAIAREAGSRTKMAVWTNNRNVDPIGTCIGARGARIQGIINEIGGEKIDIVHWFEDPEEFIRSALAPAKVTSSHIDKESRICTVYVSPDTLSLAIGREGQNVRLGSRLTGYKIDIKRDDE